MTEKRFTTNGYKIYDTFHGLFDHYCDVLDKNVSIIGYACPDFKRRVETTEETNYEITEVMKRS